MITDYYHWLLPYAYFITGYQRVLEYSIINLNLMISSGLTARQTKNSTYILISELKFGQYIFGGRCTYDERRCTRIFE